jgi:hypothetical protein
MKVLLLVLGVLFLGGGGFMGYRYTRIVSTWKRSDRQSRRPTKPSLSPARETCSGWSPRR